MGWWDERVLPRVIERTCGIDEVQPLRERACAGLRGRVLELGFGSGLNIGLYPAAVTEVLAVEPSDLAWRRSAERRERSDVPITRIGLDGQRIEADDDSVDCVLSTFTLCTIPDIGAALGESLRTLRSGGTIHVAEHGLSPDAGVARWQHRLDPLQQRLFGGCHLTRDVRDLLTTAGFGELDIDSDYLPMPRIGRPWSYGYAGQAARA